LEKGNITFSIPLITKYPPGSRGHSPKERKKESKTDKSFFLKEKKHTKGN